MESTIARWRTAAPRPNRPALRPGKPSSRSVRSIPGLSACGRFPEFPSSAVGCARVNSMWFASRWRDPPKIVLTSYRAAPSVNAAPPSCHRQPNAISLQSISGSGGKYVRSPVFCGVVCCALLAVQAAPAQESVNYASISGRVTDASGAAIEACQVTARQLDTNLTSIANTDREGRFRFPYLRVGRYEIRVHHEGFAELERSLTLTVGSAFELPISLTVASTETNVTVTGEAAVLEAARTQIAGTVPQTEVRDPSAQWAQFPRPGAAGSRRLSHQYGQQSAFCGDVRRSRPGHFRRQPAQLLEQLHRGRPFRQRRCGGAERHLLRARRGQRVPGGDFRRASRVRARAGRLHQRGHQERHQHASRRLVWLFPQSIASTPRMRFPIRPFP